MLGDGILDERRRIEALQGGFERRDQAEEAFRDEEGDQEAAEDEAEAAQNLPTRGGAARRYGVVRDELRGAPTARLMSVQIWRTFPRICGYAGSASTRA